MGLFITTYLGLIVSRWPYVVPPDYTLWQASSAYESQLFLLLGLLFVIPIVLVYTAWTYWVFAARFVQARATIKWQKQPIQTPQGLKNLLQSRISAR